jgi:hypothetical protein
MKESNQNFRDVLYERVRASALVEISDAPGRYYYARVHAVGLDYVELESLNTRGESTGCTYLLPLSTIHDVRVGSPWLDRARVSRMFHSDGLLEHGPVETAVRDY